MYESRHTCDSITSHTCMSHVTRVTQSRHTHARVIRLFQKSTTKSEHFYSKKLYTKRALRNRVPTRKENCTQGLGEVILQHIATHCITLQHTATHCNKLYTELCIKRIVGNQVRHTATHSNALQHTAAFCNTLQHTSTHCNTLQQTATHCNTLQRTAAHCSILQHMATHCNTLQLTSTHCNILQHTATHCNTLQHTATHCNTLQHTATQQQRDCKGIHVCHDSHTAYTATH